jgi:hypothetical protein
MTAARHVMRLTREPGRDAELTIDGMPVRIVNLKVTPDVTTAVYEAGEDSGYGGIPEPYVCGENCNRLVTWKHTPDDCWKPEPRPTT